MDDIIKNILNLEICDKTSQFETLLSAFQDSSSDSNGNKVISDAISLPISSDRENDIKTLFTAALKIAQAKGLEGCPQIGNFETALTVNNLFTVAKTTYGLASGEISADKVADIVADKAAIACDTIASLITPAAIECGLNRVVDIISVATAHPELKVVKSYTRVVSNMIVPKVRHIMSKRKETFVATIKSTTVKAVNWLKSSPVPALTKIISSFK